MAKKSSSPTPQTAPSQPDDPFTFGDAPQAGPAGASGETDPTVNEEPKGANPAASRKEGPSEPPPPPEGDDRPKDIHDVEGQPAVSPVPDANRPGFTDHSVNQPADGQVDPAGVEQNIFAVNPDPTAPINNPVVVTDPTVTRTDAVLRGAHSDARKVDELLGASVQPMPQSIMKSVRLGLEDLSVERQVELAIELSWTIGKAAGHIPDYHSMTENMKGAYLKGVRDIWLAAQRATRTFNE
mgnify:CR=1 FL=1